MTYHTTIELKAEEKNGIINLNPYVTEAVNKSGIRNGLVTVQSRHTTAGVAVQEDEPGIMNHDLPHLLDCLVPESKYYQHDDFHMRRPRVGPDERKNGKAHLEYLLATHHSVTLIVRDQALRLGRWQSVLFVDFDFQGRKSREIDILVMGE